MIQITLDLFSFVCATVSVILEQTDFGTKVMCVAHGFHPHHTMLRILLHDTSHQILRKTVQNNFLRILEEEY